MGELLDEDLVASLDAVLAQQVLFDPNRKVQSIGDHIGKDPKRDSLGQQLRQRGGFREVLWQRGTKEPQEFHTGGFFSNGVIHRLVFEDLDSGFSKRHIFGYLLENAGSMNTGQKDVVTTISEWSVRDDPPDANEPSEFWLEFEVLFPTRFEDRHGNQMV